MKKPRGAHHVVSDELEWEPHDSGGRSRFRRRRLSERAGAAMLGCSELEIPPGQRAWPYHWHTANEEALYVLAGEGELRTPAGTRPLRAGDYAAFPRGDAGAHEIRNTGDAPLRFLCMSTMIEPEITYMPDSGKYGLFAGSAPGGDPDARSLSRFVRVEDAPYYDGED